MTGSLTKKQLAMLLSRMAEHPEPSVKLEQYTLTSDDVSELLWIVQTTFKDVEGKIVVDLGCGIGRIAVGSALLGAEYVVGVDVDEVALRIAARNAAALDVENKISWLAALVPHVSLRADVVIQNPPYGVRRRKADRPFLEAALRMAPVVYSLHKASDKSLDFIGRYVEELGGRIDKIIPFQVSIRPTFRFHTKKSYKVDVSLYRIRRG
ncbi:MAG: METTL5 family protein [Candidatus Nezhaarchaeota archaeon]|nr:METTL5 family protein [Candidatus Nezhaarchaeota archaeon]